MISEERLQELIEIFGGSSPYINLAKRLEVREALRKVGWRTAVIWECKLRDPDSVARRLLKLASVSGSREKLR